MSDGWFVYDRDAPGGVRQPDEAELDRLLDYIQTPPAHDPPEINEAVADRQDRDEARVREVVDVDALDADQYMVLMASLMDQDFRDIAAREEPEP